LLWAGPGCRANRCAMCDAGEEQGTGTPERGLPLWRWMALSSVCEVGMWMLLLGGAWTGCCCCCRDRNDYLTPQRAKVGR